MISCIICSRQSDIPEELKKNIATTIGCEYEVIIIDNSQKEFTIFSAYTEGVHRANGDILCFMHEDILFHSNNWGNIVQSHLCNEKIGLLGVMGGHYLPDFPASWMSLCVLSGQNIQGYFENKLYKTEYHEFWSRKRSNSTEVAAVDGMWFCVQKKMFDLIAFDTELFSDYHCYDLDLCMQVIDKGLQVHVAHDILIEHKSCGSMDVRYFIELDKFYTKWKDKLPLCRCWNISEVDIKERLILAEMFMNEKRNYVQLKEELIRIKSSLCYKMIHKIFFLSKKIFAR